MKYSLLTLIIVLTVTVTTIVYHKTQQADIDYFKGHRYLENRDYQKAIYFLDKAITIAPTNIKALTDLAYSYQRFNQLKKSIEVFEKIVLLAPNDYSIKASLAQTLAWDKNYQKAISLYVEVISATDDIDSKRELAEIYIWNKEYQKAKDILNEIITNDPHDYKAKLIYAQALQNSGQPNKAIQIYEELLTFYADKKQKQKDVSEIKILLAETYMVEKNFEHSKKMYADLLETQPNNIKALIDLADILSWEKDYNAALSYYQKALAVEPDNLEAIGKIALLYKWKGDYSSAEKTYKRIIAMDLENIQAQVDLAEVYTYQGDYTKAVEFLHTSLLKNRGHRLEFLYGVSLLYSGDNKAAKQVFEKISFDAPDYHKAQAHLAGIMSAEKDYKKAIMLYRELIKESDDIHIKKEFADTLSWDKQYEEAISLYEQIVKDAKDADTKRRLAEIYIWNKQFSDANKILGALIEQNPSDYKSKILLANSMHYSGDPEKAAALYEEVLSDATIPKDEKLKYAAELEALSAESHIMVSDFTKAAEQYMEILLKDPGNIKAMIGIADILSWQQDYTGSINWHKKVLAIEPDNLQVKQKLADVYIWDKQYGKAEALSRKLGEEDPKNVKALISLGKISLYAGKYGPAEEFFKDALKMEPENQEAESLLGDRYAYSKRFDKAITIYRNILNESSDREVRIKLAQVLSWNQDYNESLDIYNELLNEKCESGLMLEKARVLGWANRYNQAIVQYQKILDKDYSQAVYLEKAEKQAYWNSRIRHAIEYCKKLLLESPDNQEVAFDLSQIYSYQRMWQKAIDSYNYILSISPVHFRAKEGLEKTKLISERPSIKSGYEYFEAESLQRDSDIKKSVFLNKLTMPLGYKAQLGLEYDLTGRKFKDFESVTENRGKVSLLYTEGLDWSADGFYDFIDYDRDIKTMQEYGGAFNFRVFDFGRSRISYEKERLENNSTVIRGGYYRNNYMGRVDLDVQRSIKIGADYLYSDYSDGNYKNEPAGDILFYLSFAPKMLTIKYRYFYRDFDDTVTEYFSPKDFYNNTIQAQWRHYLNKEGIFFGADNLYYSLGYVLGVDSEDVVGHTFTADFCWDINKRLQIKAEGQYVRSSGNVYEDKRAQVYVKHHF